MGVKVKKPQLAAAFFVPSGLCFALSLVTCHPSPRAERAMAEDSSKELFEFFQKMWTPMSFPIPGMFQPTMDAAEVDRKIRELQAVESWLKMNLNFLQMTVK